MFHPGMNINQRKRLGPISFCYIIYNVTEHITQYGAHDFICYMEHMISLPFHVPLAGVQP